MDAPDALASAAAGMRLQADRLDVIAQNLANASTAGYRQRSWSAADFSGRLASQVVVRDRQGALKRTGVATDVALVGRGYFAVATPSGVRYTRDGRLAVDAQGGLLDAQGNRLLGALGPVQFPKGAHIEPDGRIVAGGRPIDRLRIVAFAGSPLAADGPYVYAAAAAVPSRAAATVHTGYLEDSGIDPIVEMTSMVEAQRAFEADQKAAERADETLKRAVTDVPAVRS